MPGRIHLGTQRRRPSVALRHMPAAGGAPHKHAGTVPFQSHNLAHQSFTGRDRDQRNLATCWSPKATAYRARHWDRGRVRLIAAGHRRRRIGVGALSRGSPGRPDNNAPRLGHRFRSPAGLQLTCCIQQ